MAKVVPAPRASSEPHTRRPCGQAHAVVSGGLHTFSVTGRPDAGPRRSVPPSAIGCSQRPLDPRETAVIVIDDQVVWSASDLTTAAGCEYAFLRRLDEKFKPGREAGDARRPASAADRRPGSRARGARPRDVRAAAGSSMPRGAGRSDPARDGRLHRTRLPRALAKRTLAALVDQPDVVFQAGFFDGEFHGYADFLRRTDEGWVVADTKIARTAKVRRCSRSRRTPTSSSGGPAGRADGRDHPRAPGDGSFPLAEILPVFRERRERLRALIAAPRRGDRAHRLVRRRHAGLRLVRGLLRRGRRAPGPGAGGEHADVPAREAPDAGHHDGRRPRRRPTTCPTG